MAARSSWKGFVKLSLVSVPVKAYTANNTAADIRLNQLHRETKQRIQYKKWAPEVGEVSNDEIVSGYEYSKGQYVVIDVDEIEKLRTENDHSINIDGFVSPDKLDQVYHAGRTYYLVPDGAVGQKPFNLLLKGMAKNELFAIAQVVISKREQLVALRPCGKLLAMTVLHYKDKVKGVEAFADEVTETEMSEEEMKLTDTLIQASRIEDFDFGKYKDKYVERLSTLIQSKVDGQELVQVSDPEEPKIINLMDALKRSVAEAQGTTAAGADTSSDNGDAEGSSGAKSSRKMAPSTRKRSSKKKVG